MKRIVVIICLVFCFCLFGCNLMPKDNQDNHNESENNTQIENKEYVTVTFDSNGGSSVESQRVEKGSNVSKPTDPIKEGYTFIGWFIGDDNWRFNADVVNKDIVLKAKWEFDFKYEVNDNMIIITGLNNTSLTSIMIPDKIENKEVISIRDGAFRGASMTSITIPSSVTNISIGAFEGCSIKEAIIPAKACEYIKNDKLKKVIITSGTYIAYKAFSGCTSLTSITILDGVTSIGNYAFEGCTSLTSVTLPNSVTSIGEEAFCDCYKLVEVINKSSLNITIGSTDNGYIAYHAKQIITNEQDSRLTLTDDGFYLYNDGTDVYVVNYVGDNTDITIPNNVNKVDNNGFSHCVSLTSIIIPNSVISIGGSAFSGCKSLTSITIPDSVTSIGWYAFYNCSSLRSIVIPDSVTSLNMCAFSGCTSLTSIIIPNSITSIGQSAFEGCTSLINVTIPDSVTSIGWHAFSGCRLLASITISSSVTSIGQSAFECCTSLKNITISSSVISIGSGAFYGCTSLTIYCEAQTKPNGWNVNWNNSNRPVVWGYKGE